MKNDLLFECLTEEAPIKSQQSAMDHLQSSLEKELKKHNISYTKISGYYTPRRLIIFIHDLLANQSDDYIRGPLVGSTPSSIEGFVRKYNIQKDQLMVVEYKNRSFYCIATKNISLQTTLSGILSNSLRTIPWDKQMKWGEHILRWIRPVHSIVCCLNKEVIDFSLSHIVTDNTTAGHKTLSNYRQATHTIEEYCNFLEQNYVIFSQHERLNKFKKELQNICDTHQLKIEASTQQIQDTVLSGEYPHIILIEINEKLFVDIPDVIAKNVIIKNGFIPMYNMDGSLSNKTTTVINIPPKEHIVDGYNQMISARIIDAVYFWDTLIESPIEKLNKKLEKILFYNTLGSMKEKVERITILAKYLSIWVPHANILHVEQAANMCKIDLPTDLVKEFPFLQGIIASMYAEHHQQDTSVINAIKEHYLPQGMSGDMPTTPEGIALAIADKLDTLVGFFLINKTPTGSQDPFALRRAALSIIRIILHYNLDIPMNTLIYKAIQLYPTNLHKPKLHTKIIKKLTAITHKTTIQDEISDEKNINEHITHFFVDRMSSLLMTNYNIKKHTIQAITNIDKRSSFTQIFNRITRLNDFIDTKQGSELLECYKRMYNIVCKETQNEDKNSASVSYIKADLFQNQHESRMFDQMRNTKGALLKTIKHNEYQEALEILYDLCTHIHDFFEKNLINHENKEIKLNRIFLIKEIIHLFDMVADFSIMIEK